METVRRLWKSADRQDVELPADELPDLAGAFDEESEVLLDEDAEESFAEDVSTLAELESVDDVELEEELAFEESDVESLDFFFAPLVSARESLR